MGISATASIDELTGFSSVPRISGAVSFVSNPVFSDTARSDMPLLCHGVPLREFSRSPAVQAHPRLAVRVAGNLPVYEVLVSDVEKSLIPGLRLGQHRTSSV
jgi:hypothetical protein